MDEHVTLVDEHDNDVGEARLSRAHREGLRHRISAVYLTNGTGQILIQARTDGRLDHSAAGHVMAGESYLEAAERELEEELGVSGVALTAVGDCRSTENGGGIRHTFRVFRCQANPGTLNPDEVRGVFWADPIEVQNDMAGDSDDEKYCGGFKATLELFLAKLRGRPAKL